MTTLSSPCAERNPLTHEHSIIFRSEGRFVRRKIDLHRYIPDPKLRETYTVIQSFMDLATRTCYPGVKEIAKRLGRSARTVQRHQDELEALRVLQIERRKSSCRANHTSRYTFPLLDDSFYVSGG